MRDALGGTVSLVIISVFIVIAMGYMAFNVNYTKAFRMKDKIISLYEDYEGKCDQACKDAIKDYARTLGYSTDNNLQCDHLGAGWTQGIPDLYCAKEIMVDNMGTNDGDVIRDTMNKHYFKIVTRINLNIPIISNIFDFNFFYIKGDTKSFEKE